MNHVISSGRIPAKIWTDTLEESAIEQIKNLSNLPFAFKHVAIMPDCHAGYGMPIGGVLATEDVIIPNAVGVDIGCGMMFVELDYPASQLQEATDSQGTPLVKVALSAIARNIPTGFNRHNKPQDMDRLGFVMPQTKLMYDNMRTASESLGTLGGGNHFIELQINQAGNLCVMIHSGSRNLGKQICDHFNKRAVALNAAWYSSVPAKHELAFLPTNCEAGSEYIDAMNYALAFAQENRKRMMEQAIMGLSSTVKGCISILREINAHHNYAALENHFGRNVWVHRKGAIRARGGEMGIISGSMETPSYIVKGLGNPQSFMSASHGAGRTMSRKAARDTFKVEDMVNRMNAKGITLSCRDKSAAIDECGPAYKDIDTVIANEADLVEVVDRVTQIGVIKG